MSVGIVGYGSYVPWLRLSRAAVAAANAWFAPQHLRTAKGTRAMSNWDEDSITMAVEAARDCLGAERERDTIRTVLLASSTLPFAERLNAGVVCAALRLDECTLAVDLTGAQTAALSGLSLAIAKARTGDDEVLLAAADDRKTRAASTSEFIYGDGAAALLIGSRDVIAEHLGEAALTTDFVDRFRLLGEDIDYHWEERWVRDEGLTKLVPQVITRALANAQVGPEQVDFFIFPGIFSGVDARLAALVSIRPEAVVDNLARSVGDTGVAHGLLMLAGVLETARPGQIVLLAQFGGGVRALVFRVTEAVDRFRPKRGLSGWLARGVEETSYTRFLAYKGQLELERGMRGEQDRKTALTTAYRHRRALLGFVGGRCRRTGQVYFPPSRLSFAQGIPAQDTQEPYPLSERLATVLSWSAESLSSHMAPPHQYGQIDFDGGGRLLMELTDVAPGDVSTGTRVEMMFRIKDRDELRGFKRYFWKATPVRAIPDSSENVCAISIARRLDT